jgi:hypothetical protein
MCDQSFSATADSLGELVDIVALHLQLAEDEKYEPHLAYRAYLKQHSDEKKELEALLERYHVDKTEIVRSKLFRWDILRLVPYTRILKEVRTQFPTDRATTTLTGEPAVQEAAPPKTP